ncbi:hypothetical protein KAR91_64260 [Candidatus Pacearchaeota archaeon]|nr:hypothetical protein [Candidatus Pacearchaeota archaeon]
MLIPTHIEVFEDPEFCTSESSAEHPKDSAERCPKLGDYDKEGWCYAFHEWVDSERPWQKCDECKGAYQAELKRREALEDKKPEELDLANS